MRRFPVALATAFITGELLFACLLWSSAPIGTRWLGNTVMNSSDAAVYLSYLQQGADGHVLLHSLYAVEMNSARFDVVWSLLGILCRHLPLLIVQEGARAMMTCALVAAVYAAARALTQTDRETQFATLLAFGGATTGFFFSILFGAFHWWTPTTYPSIDVASEFAIAPLLMGGVHMILSAALLLTALRLAWHIGDSTATKRVIGAAVAAGVLFLFHPYFIPLCGVYLIIALIARWKSAAKKSLFTHLGIMAASLVPAIFVYVPLAFDPVFRTHHLTTNVLPLPPFLSWFLPLLPFLFALMWRIRLRVHLSEREQWLVAWIVSALICILLPFPWKRKFLEGLGIAGVFLSLPLFRAIRDWAARGPWRWMNALIGGVLLIAAWMTPLHLLTTQLSWVQDMKENSHFYQPTALFDAWTYLHDHTPTTDVVTSDTFWVNLWVPAYAGRVTWVAHDHETPDFSQKLFIWKRLMATTEPQEAQRILSENRITHLLVTSDASRIRFQTLLGSSWKIAFQKDQIAILIPRPTYSNLALSCQIGACVAP